MEAPPGGVRPGSRASPSEVPPPLTRGLEVIFDEGAVRSRSLRHGHRLRVECPHSVVASEELGGDMRVPRLWIERQEQPVEHPVEVRSEQQSPVASMFRAIREAVEVRGIEHLFGLTPGHRARRPKPLKEPFAEDPLSHADAHERLNVTATDLVCVSKQLEVEGALHACMELK